MQISREQSSVWSTLPTSDGLPKLLVKTAFSSTGYAIHLTDLSRVWHESLSQDDINARAVEFGCSIDPSDDSNRIILLRHICSALSGSSGCSVKLSNGALFDDLDLTITASLPEPLSALRWTCHLSRLADSQIATEIVQPLVSQVDTTQAQVSQLYHELATKDRIIAKICDRLEASGDQLITVFPGRSNIKLSKKKSQREQLAAHVPGLAEFDRTSWLKQFEQRTDPVDFHAIDLDSVLKSLPAPEDHRLTESKNDQWWSCLKKTISARQEICNGPLSTSPAAPSDEIVSEVQQSNDLHVRNDADEQTSTDDESTADEVNLGEASNGTLSYQSPRPDQSSNVVTSPPAPLDIARKLGTLGGRKAVTPVVQDDTHTKPKKKLGMIGGRSRQHETCDGAQVSTSSLSNARPNPNVPGDYPNPHSSVEDVSRGLVTAGSTSQQSGSERLTPSKTYPETREIRQTSEERADRKRDQLKRELQDKSKAVAKKKRKF